MKRINYKTATRILLSSFLAICLSSLPGMLLAQEDSTAAAKTEEESVPKKVKPVKNTFQSIWIIDNQTVMVPQKKTLEMDIMHRFGVVNNGYKDFWGLFAPSNIRMGINYSPIDNLNLGIGLTKTSMMLDLNAKYALIKQTKNKYPVSISYYVNAAVDTRESEDVTIYDGSPTKHSSDRYFYFHQLLIARKITEKLSVQIAPSLSHQNAVSGYLTKNDSTGKETYRSMKNSHFAFSASARYKLTEVTSLMVNYDQPITNHPSNNPNPNFSFGFEFNTSSHAFQVFAGNYASLSPHRNNLYNKNNPFGYIDNLTGQKVKGGRFLIGFNITRLWNY